MPQEIPIAFGLTAIVDDEDFDWLSYYPWRLWKGYAAANWRPSRAEKSMHRMLMRPAPGLVVDHLNGDRLDNRKSNLRVCSQTENKRNSYLYRPKGRFITTHEIIRETGLSGEYVFRALWDGRLPAVFCQDFLIRREDGEAFIAAHR